MKRRTKITTDASQKATGTVQYSLAQILGLWAAAALPMGILGWVVYPALTPDRVANPLKAAVTRVSLMTAGLVWIFVLAMLIVYREEGDLRWTTIRRRLRLNAPLDPKTSEPRRRLWLWPIPIVLPGHCLAADLWRGPEKPMGAELALSRPTSRLRSV